MKIKLKRIFTCLILMLGLIVSTVSLSSCSGGFFKTDNINIDDVKTSIDKDGNLILTITFVDDARDPIVVKIPDGEAGNGIKDIIQTPSEDGTKINVTIVYTNPDIKPMEFEINNGVSILSIQPEFKENGDIMLKITMSDGSSTSFLVPKGDKGEDGNSITGIDNVVNEDKSVTLTISFTNSEDVILTIPAPKKGNGIDFAEGTTKDGMYVITFYYTNGNSDEIKLDKPSSWISGSGAPATDLGYDRDFYFNTTDYTIYEKQNGSWNLIANLVDVGEKGEFSVTFNLNDETGNAEIPEGYLRTYKIKTGRYFACSGYEVPIPTCPGKTFDGWYTQKIYNNTLGAFNDLTCVYSNITLYARWK